MDIECTYAQEKGGQRLHIVPVVSGGVSNTALCGKHVHRWRMTINMPLANACHNCVRIDNQRGYQRALEIIRAIIEQASQR